MASYKNILANAFNLNIDWLSIDEVSLDERLNLEVSYSYAGSQGFARYELTTKAWVDITDEVEEAQARAVDAYFASL